MISRICKQRTLWVGLALAVASCSKSPQTPTSPIETVCRDDAGNPLPIAPNSARVDLSPPEFSNPTEVSNPLFPIGALSRVLLLGRQDGEPQRVETTLLSATRTMAWNDQQVETLASQYVAFVDGRLHEVAIDWYAQANDGAVWYFGEDVFNYAGGVIADTHGTWLAGREGPAAMIMPAQPRNGDVWRPENVCGIVFEEVTATSTGLTVLGPRGAVDGALRVQELHMDGSREDKLFAPGYGEFSTGAPGGDLEAVAVAVPTDALPGAAPAAIAAIESGAAEIFAAAESLDWDAVASALTAIQSAWDGLRSGGVPAMLEAQMDDALDALGTAAAARGAVETRQTAIHVARAALDLALQHRGRDEIDMAHIELWIRQIVLDAAEEDANAVVGDIATLQWIRDRIVDEANVAAIDTGLAHLRAAAETRDMATVITVAAGLRESIAGVGVSLR